MELKVDPNSRLDRKVINRIKKNILTSGFNSKKPIIFDQNHWILDGNHRYAALSELELLDIGVYYQINWQDFLRIHEGLLEKYQTGDGDKIPDSVYYKSMIAAGRIGSA